MSNDDPALRAAEEILKRLGFGNEQIRANRAGVPDIIRTAFADALEDSARLDWLETQDEYAPPVQDPNGHWWIYYNNDEGLVCNRDTLRAAIDIVRKNNDA